MHLLYKYFLYFNIFYDYIVFVLLQRARAHGALEDPKAFPQRAVSHACNS